mgnify:CR=1 FL=1
MAEKTGSIVPIVLSVLAILIAAGALVIVATKPTTTTGRIPKTHAVTIVMSEQKVSTEVNETHVEVGEFHKWEPNVLVFHLGDKIELTVKNPLHHAHSFTLAEYGVDSGRLTHHQEYKTTITLNKAGVFTWRCGIPFNEAQGDCDPDHPTLTGTLIVIE